jgi:hypothetical protein
MTPDELKKIEIYLIILLIVCIIITYFIFGPKTCFSNMMLLFIYLIVVPTLFFTYVVHIEKIVVGKQIDKLFKTIKTNTDDFNISMPNVNLNVDKSDDKNVDKLNSKIIKKAFLIIVPIFIVGLILTYLLCKVYKIDYLNLVKNNLILLIIIVFIEMCFFTFISKNYRSLDSNKISNYTLLKISDKMKVSP